MKSQRLTGVRQQMAKRGIDAFLISNLANVNYLSGFTGSAGAAIITPDRDILLVDGRYILQAGEEAKGFELSEYSQAIDPLQAAGEVLNAIKPKTAGFEGDYISFSSYTLLRDTVEKGIELKSVARTVEELKITKDVGEIELVKRACKMVDDCFAHLVSWIKPGMTESEVAHEISSFLFKQGSPRLAFDSIVAAGPNAAFPHHKTGNDVIKPGQMVKIDYGATVGHLGSDITRVVFLGEPDDKQREVYNTVLDAQLKAIEAIKPGKLGKEIDAVARDYIASKGYGEYFTHNLGHNIPKTDGPGFTTTSETVLAPGMVITVEPGIYIEGWGGVRIEDDIVVTETGCDNLMTATKEIIVIK